MPNKIALVTGASSGIGKATCNRLIADGYYIMATGRRIERLQELKTQWQDRVHIEVSDVRQYDDVERVVMRTLEHFGQLDVLVNNAGVGMMAPLEDGNINDWHAMIDVNVKGVLNFMHACLPHLIHTRGHIINVASVAAHDVFINGVVYCASKHAVNAITVGFRKEFRDRVKVSNISPGAVQTEFVQQTTHEKLKEEFAKNFDDSALNAQDIADAISHILNQPTHIAVNEYIIRPNK